MLKWRIYYDNGTTFDSTQGGPGDAPAWGALMIVQLDPTVGRHIMWHPEKGFFVWCKEHGEWDIKDFTGLLDFLANFPGCVVRMGRGVPNDRFQAIYRSAVDDPGFPKKSGLKGGERAI